MCIADGDSAATVISSFNQGRSNVPFDDVSKSCALPTFRCKSCACSFLSQFSRTSVSKSWKRFVMATTSSSVAFDAISTSLPFPTVVDAGAKRATRLLTSTKPTDCCLDEDRWQVGGGSTTKTTTATIGNDLKSCFFLQARGLLGTIAVRRRLSAVRRSKSREISSKFPHNLSTLPPTKLTVRNPNV